MVPCPRDDRSSAVQYYKAELKIVNMKLGNEEVVEEVILTLE